MNPWHDDPMPKRSSRKRDFMQVARELVEHAIGERMDGAVLEKPVDLRNPRAVAIGSLGGKKGGKARARKLSPAKRKAIAKKAALARWKPKK
jgi:hypothetical protein